MSPLHQFGLLLRQALAAVPLSAVRLLFVAVPLLILVWVLTLPDDRTCRPGDSSLWNNLKWWAAVALLIQIAIYVLI